MFETFADLGPMGVTGPTVEQVGHDDHAWATLVADGAVLDLELLEVGQANLFLAHAGGAGSLKVENFNIHSLGDGGWDRSTRPMRASL